MCSLSGATTTTRTLHDMSCSARNPAVPTPPRDRGDLPSSRCTTTAQGKCGKTARIALLFLLKRYHLPGRLGANTRETGLKKGRFALSITPAFPFPTSCGSCRVVVEAAFNETLSGDYVRTGIEAAAQHNTAHAVQRAVSWLCFLHQSIGSSCLLLSCCCLLLAACCFPVASFIDQIASLYACVID